MAEIKTVKKRSGEVVAFEPEKLTHWAKWAGNIGVDWFGVVADAYKKCPDECTTQDLQNAMIQACMDKEDTPHMLMAGRLMMGSVYKNAFGGHDKIPTVQQMYENMVGAGLWEDMGYDVLELIEAQSFINHERDLNSVFSVVNQITTKYAIKDIDRNIALESPAFVWMRMALGVCKDEPKSTRMQEVRAYYEDYAEGRINAPTPNINNLGTLKRSYASCCVYKSNDELGSLAAGDHIATIMTAASAGIGGMLMTRAKGDGVRKNTIRHGGKLPYYNAQASVVNANLQGGRGGAETMHTNDLDPEIETLLRLRHPTTVASKAERRLDYSFGFHPLLAEKAAKNEQWMLVSYKVNPELWEAMYKADGSFERLYAEHEKSNKRKKFISARKLALEFLRMQEETGRMYEHNTLEMNRHTPFKDVIYSSNLCQEIGLPTQGYKDVTELYRIDDDVQGEIGLCNLGAVVAGHVTPEMYEEVAYRTLKMVDNVISIMDYPFPHLKYTAQARRSAGIGITNLAHDMAVKGLRYDTKEGKAYMHRLAEMHSYWLHKASVRLAKERGKCDWFHKTKYADGWLPIDTYCKHIDNVTDQPLLCDWEGLRKEIAEHGMRNSVLEAFMPVESSSLAGNTTNSLYPIRELVVVKTSGTNKNVFLAPDMEELKGRYQMAWDVSHKDMAEMYGIFQKFCGQAISADFYRSFKKGEVPRISAKELFEDWLYRITCGLKSKYYSNTAAGLTLVEDEDEVNCETCKL
jgi:ribonucleoside-diphosphate reductase alpha chain